MYLFFGYFYVFNIILGTCNSRQSPPFNSLTIKRMLSKWKIRLRCDGTFVRYVFALFDKRRTVYKKFHVIVIKFLLYPTL